MSAVSPMSLRIISAVGRIFIACGAGLVLAGSLGPWAKVVLFKNIDLSLPGFFFVDGSLCLAAAAIILLGVRRSPLLCLVVALLVLHWVSAAHSDLPRHVKHQEIGAQMALFPINRLLDQFHIGDIVIADWAMPDSDLLGGGLIWSGIGSGLLLLGSALSLPHDPLVSRIYERTARRHCRSCGALWLAARNAQYCPECGEPAPGGKRHCVVCRTEAASNDIYCINCGTMLSDNDHGANRSAIS
jgi:hypothetical protein